MFELFTEGYRNLIQNSIKPTTPGLSAVLLKTTASNPTYQSNANMTYVRANTASPTQFSFTDLGYNAAGNSSYIYLTASGLNINSGDFISNCDQYGHIINEQEDYVYGYFKIRDTIQEFLNAGVTFTWSGNDVSDFSLGSESLSAGYSSFFDPNVNYDLINNGRLAVVRNVGGSSSSTFFSKIKTMNTMEDIATGNNINGGNDTVTMITSGHSLSSFGIKHGSKTLSASPIVVNANVPGTYDRSVIMFYVENGALNDGGGSAIPFAMFTDNFNFTFTDDVFILVTSNGIINIS
jgi:hypothetical protein